MNIAVVLSGGVGSRFGATIPKQYIEVGGKPIFLYCIETFLGMFSIDALNICVADEWKEFVEEHLSALTIDKPIYFSQPGETRQYTIYNALRSIRKRGGEDADIVIIHDAARPLVSTALIQSCIDNCAGADGVLPVLPVKDTIYQSVDGRSITGLLPRTELFAGQAPESFKLGVYLNAHESLSHEELLKINGSSEIAHQQGLRIHLVPGDERNFKVTTLKDLEDLQNIIAG